jgi:mannose-6-phosphate isomerase
VLRPEQRAQRTQPLARDDWGTILTACRYFLLERWTVAGTHQVEFAPGETFHLFSCIAGAVTLHAPPAMPLALTIGQTALVPASTVRLFLDGQGTLLVASVPDLARDVVAPLRARGYDDHSIAQLAGDTGDLPAEAG